MRSWSVALVVGLLASCSDEARVPSIAPPLAPAPPDAGGPVQGGRPPIVVTIVVDQFAAWIASERLPLLPADGGFARLLSEGTYVREARYAHAATDTAPGHAALYTGAPPRMSGITSNERIDPGSRRHLSILRDTGTRVVTPSGTEDGPGSSARAYLAPTLADSLRQHDADATIISLSLKDRGGIPGGGQRPTATLWFDPERDQFVTSTAFAPSLPRWSNALASRSAVSEARRIPWVPLDASWVATHAATRDNQPGEGAWPGQTALFPHDYLARGTPTQAFRASPFGDATVLALARAAIQAEGFGDTPTLLALSLSSNDYVGHVYGPDSWEAWDNLMVLDRALAELFHTLDARVGRDGYAVVLSADHGATPMPETSDSPGARPWCNEGSSDRWMRPCTKGSRILLKEFGEELDRVATATLGKGAWILGFSDPYVILSDAARALPSARRERLLQALVTTILRHNEVSRVIDTSTISERCPAMGDESDDALVCRAFFKGAGDLYVYTKPGSFFDADYTPGHGSSHGAPYVFDRAVPILARAPHQIASGRVVEGPLSFATFTRTVSSLLGIQPPSECVEGTDLATPRTSP